MRRRKRMSLKIKIRDFLEYFTPVSKREFRKCINEVADVIDGIIAEAAQQAEISSNIMQNLAEAHAQKKKPVIENEVKDDIAFN